MNSTDDNVPLNLLSVSASYGKTRIISDISFALKSGEAFGLIGLNGAGKTTLIRAILALGQSTGQVSFFGKANSEAQSRSKMIYLYRAHAKTRNLSWVMRLKLSDTWSRNVLHSLGMVSRMNTRTASANCF